MSLKVLLCSIDDALPHHWSVLRVMHPLTPPKFVSTCLGGHCPSSKDNGAGCKASCAALGGHFWPWLAVVEMVVVGHWRLVMSDVFIPT